MIVEFKVSNNSAYLLEFGKGYVRFYKNHERMTLKNGSVYEITTEYSTKDIENLRYVQNGDVLYLFTPNHPIKTLSRYGDFDWRLEEFVLKNGPWDRVNSTNTTLIAAGTEGTVEIEASADTFKDSDVGRLVRLTVTDDDKIHWQAEKKYSTGQVVKSDGKYYKNVDGETSGNEKPVHTEGTKYDGGIKWEYLHSGYGTARITSFIDSKKVRAKVLDLMPNDVVNKSTTHWELGLISSATGYPICGTFFRSRFCFMLDVNGIPYVCISCYDDYNNFADMDFGEVLSNNAITMPIYSDHYNESKWLCSSNVLFVGTSGAEFYIDSAGSGDPFGPNNSKIQQISNIGSKAITPVKIGAHIIFVTATGTSIRDIIYSFSTDSYDPIDLGIYGKHLLTTGITGMRYQEYPDKVIWFVMQDGKLVGMTFSSEQKVNALHQHDLSGDVKEIAVLPDATGKSEELWLVVNRGDECVEYLDSGIPAIIPSDVQQEEYIKENAVYLDSCVKYNVNKEISEYLDVSMRFAIEDEENDVTFVDGFGRKTTKKINADNTSMELRTKYEKTFDNKNGYELSFSYETTENYPAVPLSAGTSSVNEEEEVPQGVYLKLYPARKYAYRLEIINTTNGDKMRETIGETEDGEIKTRIFYKALIPTLFKWTIYAVEDRSRIISGLNHLEGKTVSVYADGAEMSPQNVKNGSINLERDVKNALVGLRINSEYIPQTIIVPTQNGGGVGDVQRIDHVTVTLWNSLGGSVGNSSKEYPIVYRKTTDKLGESTPLFTGNKTIPVSFNTTTIEEKGATVSIKNDSAYPMHILCISPKVNTSGNGL